MGAVDGTEGAVVMRLLFEAIVGLKTWHRERSGEGWREDGGG